MRKQYHFWPGADGLDAWDVDRLIATSAPLAAEDVPVAAIGEVDTVYWFDDMHEPTIRRVIEHIRLIQDVDRPHPIMLGADGRVMDGMHRVARAILDGQQTIRAIRLPELPEPDFRNCKPDELPYWNAPIRRLRAPPKLRGAARSETPSAAVRRDQLAESVAPVCGLVRTTTVCTTTVLSRSDRAPMRNGAGSRRSNDRSTRAAHRGRATR